MEHFQRIIIHVAVFLGLMAGALVLYKNLGHVGRDFYIVHENGETVPASRDQFGIEKREAAFVTQFRKRIFPEAVGVETESVEQLKERIKNELLEGYARDGHRLDEWADFASDRERFTAYLMLRVNGSLPVFYPTKSVSEDLADILFSREGNCSHHSYRLLMILDIFSIQGRLVSWWSPSIEGHVFVDAFDPAEGRSYFLDPTSNLMASFRSTTQRFGFLDTIETMSPHDRKVFLFTQLKTFPNFVSRSHELDQDFAVWSANNYLRVKDSIITGLSFEFPVMQRRWQDNESPWPKTLCELANEGWTVIQAFRPAGCPSRSTT